MIGMANRWHDLWVTHWVTHWVTQWVTQWQTDSKAIANVWLSQTQTQTQTQGSTYVGSQTYLGLWFSALVKLIFQPTYVTREKRAAKC